MLGVKWAKDDLKLLFYKNLLLVIVRWNELDRMLNKIKLSTTSWHTYGMVQHQA